MKEQESALTNSPPWEIVKTTTYGRYLNCVRLFEAVEKDYSNKRAFRGSTRSKFEGEFIASIKGLYIDLAPKLGYPKNSKDFACLREMDAYLDPEGPELTYRQTVAYFGKLRKLLEVLGFTRTERREQEPGEGLTGGLNG